MGLGEGVTWESLVMSGEAGSGTEGRVRLGLARISPK